MSSRPFDPNRHTPYPQEESRVPATGSTYEFPTPWPYSRGREGVGSSVAGLRVQCPIKWNHFHFTGDGSTKTWSVGNYYVVDFISIYINGIMQTRTTHFAQTDPDLGTFTMTQSPRDDDDGDVWFATCCDEDFKVGCVGPTGGWIPPGTDPKGEGARVYISGVKSGGGAFFAWTEDVYGTVTWTENSTGLPSSGVSEAKLLSDPWNVSTTAYMVVRVSNDDTIYKNTALRTGGSWFSVFAVSDWNTLTSRSDSGIFIGGRVGDTSDPGLRATIAVPEFIAFYVRPVDGVATTWVVHSHDAGSNFTAVQLSGGTGRASLVIGQHDGTLMYLYSDHNTNIGVYKSTDHGHTFSFVAHPESGAGGVSGSLYLPYDGNSDDAILLWWQGSDVIRKSSDSAATWGDLNSSPTMSIDDRAEISVQGSDTSILASGGAAGYWSVDGGATWASSSPPETIRGLAILKQGRYYACSGGATNEVMISQDWITFTDKSGDIDASIGSGTMVDSIVPDWTS